MIILQNSNYLYGRKYTRNGFGIVELVLSSSILVIILLLSVYFTSLRQKVIREAFITRAIENEIQRDIENIRGIMWRNSYHPANGSTPSRYDIERAVDTGICQDTNKILSEKIWNPQSSRDKVINENITITREVSSEKPLSLESSLIDNSISKISYIVEMEDKKIEWMSFDISSEVHSWCPPGG